MSRQALEHDEDFLADCAEAAREHYAPRYRAARLVEWDRCKACNAEVDARYMDRGLCPDCLEAVEHIEAISK
jgi:hypothetical protein